MAAEHASGLARGEVTLWHTDDRGATWTRSVHGSARCEETASESSGQAGPNPSGKLLVWCFDGGFAPVPGDYVAQGNVEGVRPPDGCRRVSEVLPLHGRAGFHHVQVVAL